MCKQLTATAIVLMMCFAHFAGLAVAEEERIPKEAWTETRAGVAKSKAFLDSIEMPVVEFKGTTFKEAIDFVWAISVERDADTLDPAQKGVAIQYPSSMKSPKKVSINYRAEDATLTTILKEVAKQGKLDLYITSVGVVFCPSGFAPFPNAKEHNGKVFKTLYKAALQQPSAE